MRFAKVAGFWVLSVLFGCLVVSLFLLLPWQQFSGTLRALSARTAVERVYIAMQDVALGSTLVAEERPYVDTYKCGLSAGTYHYAYSSNVRAGVVQSSVSFIHSTD
jgi:hypothetical protein